MVTEAVQDRDYMLQEWASTTSSDTSYRDLMTARARQYLNDNEVPDSLTDEEAFWIGMKFHSQGDSRMWGGDAEASLCSFIFNVNISLLEWSEHPGRAPGAVYNSCYMFPYSSILAGVAPEQRLTIQIISNGPHWLAILDGEAPPAKVDKFLQAYGKKGKAASGKHM